jgi:hypothetical protein
MIWLFQWEACGWLMPAIPGCSFCVTWSSKGFFVIRPRGNLAVATLDGQRLA